MGEDRAILLSEDKLTLDGRYVWVDIWAFEQVITRINQLLCPAFERADPNEIEKQSERLFKLYAGAFLSNEPEEAWSLPLREREWRRFMRAVGEVCRYW